MLPPAAKAVREAKARLDAAQAACQIAPVCTAKESITDGPIDASKKLEGHSRQDVEQAERQGQLERVQDLIVARCA